MSAPSDIDRCLAELGDAAAPARRRAAAEALGRAGYAARAAEGALSTRLADADADVRHAAAVALAAVGPQSNATIQALGRALADPDARVRAAAAAALAEVGAEAVPQLLPALGDPDPSVRAAVAHALGRAGPAGAAALDALLGAVRDAVPDVVVAVAAALVDIRPAAARIVRPLLDAALATGDATAASRVLDEIARLGAEAEGPLAVLAAGSPTDGRLRALVDDALGRVRAVAAAEARANRGAFLGRLFGRRPRARPPTAG